MEKSDPYRPHYHFTPPSMWLNDPNGLVYFDGEYHLFYQFHPDSTVWGPMHWGHAVSRDLVHWQHLPIALRPDPLGTIFSGSAVVDRENTAGFGREALVAVFTHDGPAGQQQSLAYSSDRGRSWRKFSGNPVLPIPPETVDFRDPKVFWHAETTSWVMVLAVGKTIHFYRSRDLVEWRRSGTFGGHGASGGVWETPDLFELPIEGKDETRWVLTVSVGDGGPAGGSGTQYFIGYFNGQTFRSENPPERTLWADFGADFYAPQTWSNEPQGRRLLIAWANNQQYANQIPAAGFRGMFSLPRRLGLRVTPDGPRLVQRPVKELAGLRAESRLLENLLLEAGSDPLEGMGGEALEIIAEFEPGAGTSRFGLRLRAGSEQETLVGYDCRAGRLFVDRRRSGRADFHPDFARRHEADLEMADGRLRLHVLLDRISVEVFANDGLMAFTDLIFPEPEGQGIGLFVEGGEVLLHRLDLHKLGQAVFLEQPD
jgi:fructan beta-fructosidase